MEVYIEYVAINNFLIDYMLVSLTRKSMNLPYKKAYVCLAALVGVVFAIITPLFKMNAAFTVIAKFFEGALIILISGKFTNFRAYVRSFYLFLFFTFAFGGAVFGVFCLSGRSYDVFTRTSPEELTLTIILAVVFVLYVITTKVIGKLYKKREITNFIRKCEFTVGGKTYVANGFLDSGNRLRYKNEPIIIASQKLSEKLLIDGAFSGVMPRFASVSTIAGERLIKVYKISRIKIYNGEAENIIDNVMLGITERDVRCGGEYDLILGTVFA